MNEWQKMEKHLIGKWIPHRHSLTFQQWSAWRIDKVVGTKDHPFLQLHMGTAKWAVNTVWIAWGTKMLFKTMKECDSYIEQHKNSLPKDDIIPYPCKEKMEVMRDEDYHHMMNMWIE